MKRIKHKPPVLQIRHRNGDILFDAPLYHLRLDPELINRLSNVYFSDPNPCTIHQNAVLTRVFAELEMALGEKGEVAVSSLAPQLREYLSQYPGSAYCCLSEKV